VRFLCYHSDRPGAQDLRFELVEQHWAYMERFADGMIARGPTLTEDGATATGSVHVVDVPDPAAARAFAFEEPGYQAGVYRDVLLRRWDDRLGRTMWDFPGGREGGTRFLVLGLGTGEPPVGGLPADHDSLVAHGELLSDDGSRWLGTAVLLRADDADAAHAVLDGHAYDAVEVHRWQFGGRPD
jgi:uncharacterized protein YciI